MTEQATRRCGFRLLPALFTLLLVTACSENQELERFTSVPRPQTAAERAAAQEQLDTIDAETIIASAEAWPKIIRSQGSLESDSISTVASEISGRVLKLHVDIGDEVDAGDLVAELDPSDYELLVRQSRARLNQAKSAIGLKADDGVEKLDPLNAPPSREAKAVWDEAKQQVARLKQLAAQNAISDTDLDAAIAAERVADARYSSALNSVREKMAMIQLQQAELMIAEEQLTNTKIHAPIAGRIQTREVAIGNYLSLGQSIVTIAVTKKLRYRSAVPERYAQELAIGQQLVIHPSGQLQERAAAITRIAPTLDRQTRSLAFEAIVQNEDELIRPGIFAESDIVLDDASQSIVLPNSSIMRFAGIDKVWLVKDGVASEKVVTVGRRAEDQSEILDGVRAGDIILRDANQGRNAKIRSILRSPDAQTSTPSSSVQWPYSAILPITWHRG